MFINNSQQGNIMEVCTEQSWIVHYHSCYRLALKEGILHSSSIAYGQQLDKGYTVMMLGTSQDHGVQWLMSVFPSVFGNVTFSATHKLLT
jgi:hypothetical protein